MVFLLPADSGEKVSLGVSILVAISVFLLLVAGNVPDTSESVPLLGQTTHDVEIRVIDLKSRNLTAVADPGTGEPGGRPIPIDQN